MCSVLRKANKLIVIKLQLERSPWVSLHTNSPAQCRAGGCRVVQGERRTLTSGVTFQEPIQKPDICCLAFLIRDNKRECRFVPHTTPHPHPCNPISSNTGLWFVIRAKSPTPPTTISLVLQLLAHTVQGVQERGERERKRWLRRWFI